MAEVWDDSIKRLFREHPQDYVSWLIEGATYEGTVSGELKNRTRRTDLLMNIRKRGRESLLHIEVQSSEDREIEDRLMEYNLMAKLTHHKSVITFLILLKPMTYVPASPVIDIALDEYEVWRFNYHVVKLWEESAFELVRSGLTGVFPLIPLTNGGTEQEALTTVVAELYAAHEYELLSLSRLIAGMVMKQPAQQEMLRRMFAMYRDVLEESWVYQEILREGHEKGLTEGLEKGLEKGLNQGLERGRSFGEMRALLTIIEKRFPELLQPFKERIEGVTDTSLLERLIGDVSVAQTIEEARQTLNTLAMRENGKNGAS